MIWNQRRRQPHLCVQLSQKMFEKASRARHFKLFILRRLSIRGQSIGTKHINDPISIKIKFSYFFAMAKKDIKFCTLIWTSSVPELSLLNWRLFVKLAWTYWACCLCKNLAWRHAPSAHKVSQLFSFFIQGITFLLRSDSYCVWWIREKKISFFPREKKNLIFYFCFIRAGKKSNPV